MLARETGSARAEAERVRGWRIKRFARCPVNATLCVQVHNDVCRRTIDAESGRRSSAYGGPAKRPFACACVPPTARLTPRALTELCAAFPA